MKINRIKVINLRNHTEKEIFPVNGINTIYGNNGNGKTSILEAIYYCSFGKSFKTSNENELLKFGEKQFVIQLDIENEGKLNKLSVQYANSKKMFYLNEKPVKRISDLNKILNVLLFEPNLTYLFSGDPSLRRTYLDMFISKIDNSYLQLLKKYRYLLKERNLALKNENVDKTYIFTITNEMVGISEDITLKRLKMIENLNKILPSVANKISNKRQTLKLIYHPFINYSENYKTDLLRAYQNSYENDLAAKITTIGIHKEDYYMLLDDKNVARFGSQGENRLCAISFCIAPYFIESNNKPIILLDDVLSELDDKNKLRLIKFISKFEQSFITTTKKIGTGNEIRL